MLLHGTLLCLLPFLASGLPLYPASDKLYPPRQAKPGVVPQNLDPKNFEPASAHVKALEERYGGPDPAEFNHYPEQAVFQKRSAGGDDEDNHGDNVEVDDYDEQWYREHAHAKRVMETVMQEEKNEWESIKAATEAPAAPLERRDDLSASADGQANIAARKPRSNDNANDSETAELSAFAKKATGDFEDRILLTPRDDDSSSSSNRNKDDGHESLADEAKDEFKAAVEAKAREKLNKWTRDLVAAQVLAGRPPPKGKREEEEEEKGKKVARRDAGAMGGLAEETVLPGAERACDKHGKKGAVQRREALPQDEVCGTVSPSRGSSRHEDGEETEETEEGGAVLERRYKGEPEMEYPDQDDLRGGNGGKKAERERETERIAEEQAADEDGASLAKRMFDNPVTPDPPPYRLDGNNSSPEWDRGRGAQPAYRGRATDRDDVPASHGIAAAQDRVGDEYNVFLDPNWGRNEGEA